MAFSATNVQTARFGNLKVTYGDWSCALGDTAGTVGVEGGRVYDAVFNTNTASGQIPPAGALNWSYTTSGDVSTVTVNNQIAATGGTFLIIHK